MNIYIRTHYLVVEDEFDDALKIERDIWSYKFHRDEIGRSTVTDRDIDLEYIKKLSSVLYDLVCMRKKELNRTTAESLSALMETIFRKLPVHQQEELIEKFTNI